MARESPPLFRWQRAVRDSDLPSVERLIALTLSTWMSAEDLSCHPRQETLAAACGLHIKTLRPKVKALRDAGWVSVEYDRRGEGRGTRTTYTAVFPTRTATAANGTAPDDFEPEDEADDDASTTAENGSAPPVNAATTAVETGTGPSGGAPSGTGPSPDHYRDPLPTTTADRGSEEETNEQTNEQTKKTRGGADVVAIRPDRGAGRQLYNFEAFFDRYPRKGNERGARKAWVSARNRMTDVQILAALDRWIEFWIADTTSEHMIPEAANWFARGRHTEDPPRITAKPPSQRARQTRNDKTGRLKDVLGNFLAEEATL